MATEKGKQPEKVKRRLGLRLGKAEESVEQEKVRKAPPGPQRDPKFQILKQSRIVVSEMIYHQNPEQQPKLTTNKFARHLASGEQPFVRETELTARWVHVDIGWVKEVGQLIIRNREARVLYTNPTQAQKADLETHTLEIGITSDKGEPVPFGIIRPGESCRFEPHNDTAIWIRSRGEKIKVTITAIPE